MAGLFNCSCLHESDKNLLISALAEEKSTWEKLMANAPKGDVGYIEDVAQGIINHVGLLTEMVEQTPNCEDEHKPSREELLKTCVPKDKKLSEMTEEELAAMYKCVTGKEPEPGRINLEQHGPLKKGRDTITKELMKSMEEESQASHDYNDRAFAADVKTANLYSHISNEEEQHFRKFAERLNELSQ